MVLTGKVGRQLVGLINATVLMRWECRKDADLFIAHRTQHVIDGKHVDLGLVGDVVKVNTDPITDLIANGRIQWSHRLPRKWTNTNQPTGQVLNVNADTAAPVAQRLVQLSSWC